MKKFAFVILLFIPLIGFGQAEKRYRSIIVDSLKALNGGRIDVKDTLLLDSLAQYNTDLSLQYTSRSLVDSAFVGTAMSGAGGNTIYSADDNLVDNRIVTQGANTLSFTADPVNAFSIDGTTFSVDASNNRVGIGIATPAARLNARGIDATSGNDALLIENNVGTDLFIIENAGEVGIGTSNPIARLHVEGQTLDVVAQFKRSAADPSFLKIEIGASARPVIYGKSTSAGLGMGFQHAFDAGDDVLNTNVGSFHFAAFGNDAFGPLINANIMSIAKGALTHWLMDVDGHILHQVASSSSVGQPKDGFDFVGGPGAGLGFLIRRNDATADGQLLDSPDLTIRAQFDSDPSGGFTRADFDAVIHTDVTGGGASPTGKLIFSVQGNEGLSVDQSGDVTINNILVEPTIPLTLGVAATTFATTGNKMKLTGDGGSNTIATITGGIDGMTLTLTFVDALVTLTDDNTSTVNTINLPASFVSTANDVVVLEFDGTSWRQASSSVN